MSNPRIEVDFILNAAQVVNGVNAATSKLDQLGNAAQSTAPKFDQLSKATSRYNGIGIDFARVIQDAPFGIIGVGNNITQLAQSFSALGKEGDSLTSKIKLAFGQIFSSGNLLVLAVSAITTVWTLYEKGVFKSEKATKSLKEELDKYRETLQGVTKANLDGQIAAQKEISTLKGLELQATNTALSTKQRNDAVNELQKLYPEYFANLTKEQIKNGDVGDAYLKVTESLIAKAKAQAVTNEIAQNAIEILTIETKLEDLKAQRLLKTADAQAQLDALIEKRQKDGFLTQGDLQRYDTLIKSINTANESLKEESNLQGEIVKIRKEDEQLIGKLNTSLEQGGNLIKDSGKSIKSNSDALKKYSEGWDEYNLQQESASFLTNKLTINQKDLEKNIRGVLTAVPKEPVRIVSDDEALQAYNDELFRTQKAAYQASLELMRSSDSAYKFSDNLDKLSGKEVKVDVKVQGLSDETADQLPFIQQLETALNPKKFTEFEERISDFAFTVRDLLQNNLTDAFVDLGYTIGESLATGANVIQAVGQSILKSFGRFLGQFGEQLIAYGVATIAFGKASIGLSNPFTAIPSGGLAIAAGVALTAIAGVIGGLGKKGPGGAGGGGGAGAGGGSAATGTSFTGGAQGGLFAQNRDLNGELVVRGQDLVYVFNQANDRINKG